MANTLMFEVGIKRAEQSYKEIYDEVMKLAKMGDKPINLKIQLEKSADLQNFLKVLSEFGSGQQLKPLMEQVERLQNRLISMGDSGKYMDFLRTEALSASRALEEYNKKIEQTLAQRSAYKKGMPQYDADMKAFQAQAENIRNSQGYKDAVERNARAANNLRIAEERLANEHKNEGNAATDLNSRIQQLSQSIESLSGKTFSVNMGNEFKTWAEQVQALVAQVKDLVAQMEKLHSVHGKDGGVSNNLKEQSEAVTQLEERIKRLQSTLATRTGWVQNERDAIASMYDGLNINGAQRLLDIEKERKQNLAEITQKEKELSTLRETLTKRNSPLIAEEKNVLKSIEKMQAFVNFYKNPDFVLKAPGRDGSIYSIADIFKNLNISNVNTQMNQLADHIAWLKDELRRLGSNSSVDTSGLQTLIQKANEAYTAYEKIRKEQDKAFGKYAEIANPSQQYLTAERKRIDISALYSKDESLAEEARVLKHHLDRETDSLAKQAETSKQLKQAKEELATANKKVVDSETNKTAPQGGLLDPKQFTTLQEAIDKIIGEINRLRDAFAGIGKIEGIEALKTSVNGLQVEVNNLVSAMMKITGAIHIDKSAEEIAAFEKKIAELKTQYEQLQAQVQQTTTTIQQQATAANNAGTATQNAANEDEKSAQKANIERQRQLKLLSEVNAMMQQIANTSASSSGINPGKINEIKSLFESLHKSLATIPPSKSLQELSAEFSALKSSTKGFFNEIKQGSKAVDSIRLVRMALKEVNDQIAKGNGTPKMEGLRNSLQAINREMHEMIKVGNFAGIQSLFKGHTGMSDGAVNIIRQVVSALKEAEKASGKLALEQHNVSSAFGKSTSEMLRQSQVLSDLKMMAMQYLSVWGAQQFLNNIIEQGGQLEQQRLSIGAILQDTAQANHLFSQIKALAIKSPFGVTQLDQMTKQLSAYSFKYSELYDWTTRLADISAATGTSVDRLALALGHVRSEGALSGYTLRQFSMGNIPLLEKLSEKLGKTKQEIRKMVRGKEIGYEDVLDVLKQLTDEGGMFYKAQETMAQALNAKFKNLRDSFQIMYSEMAEGAPGDFLKDVAATLTKLSREWQVLLPMIGAAGSMWALSRVSAALVNTELAKMTALTNANTLASSKYSVAQLRQIALWERMPKSMIRARLALQGFRASLISLGRMVFSWPMAIFAAIEAITYMWSKQSREAERAQEMTETFMNTAQQSQKNISKQLETIDPYSKGMSDSQMKTGIESMTEAIKNYGVNAQEVLSKAFGSDAEGRVMSLAERYQYLRSELEKTDKVYKEMQKTNDAFEFGINYSDSGWFDDNVETDLTNYADALKEYDDSFTKMTADYATAVNKALDAAKAASPEFRRVADELNSDADRVKWLFENQSQYSGTYNVFKSALHKEDPNAGGGVLGEHLIGNLNSAEKKAIKELDSFFTGVEKNLERHGYNFAENGKHLTEVQVGNLLRQSKEWLDKHPEWSNIYDVIWDKLNQRWGLPIVPEVEEIEEELPQWIQEYQKELDKTGIKLTATMSPEQIIDEMKKAYDQAQTTINKLGPIALTAKINIQGLSDEDIEQYNNPLSPKYNPEMYETLKGLKKANDTKSQVDAAAKKRGVKLEGMKKDGSHKNAQEKKDTESAKAVREQVRVMKEAADAFQYWREKVGDDAAWAHVEDEFGDVLEKIGVTAKNVNDLRNNLKNVPNLKEYKAIKDQKVKTEIDKEIAKEQAQLNRKDFEKTADQFASKVQIELDGLTRAWDIFNSVREATGNVELAVQISGADYQNGKTRNLADALKEKIQKDFDAAGGSIAFDMNLSDKDIEEQIKKATPKASEDQIKGLVEEYKKWRDLQRDVLKSDIDVFAKLVGGAKDYDSQLQLINEKLRKQIESNNELAKNGTISKSSAKRANDVATIQAEDEKWKISLEYINLMNYSLASTRKEVDEGINHAMDMLNKKMEANLITAKEYTDEMANIRNIQSEWTKNSFFGSTGSWAAGMMGGLSGRRNYYQTSLNKSIAAIATYEQRIKKGIATDDDIIGLNVARRKAKGDQGKLDKLDKTENLLGSFDALAKAMDPVINLFDQLGLSGIGSVLSAGQSALSQAATMGAGAEALFAGAGPYGAAIGAGLSLVSSLFGGHDEALQKEIEASKQRQKEMENLTKNLETALDRALGGVYGIGNTKQGQMAMAEFNSKALEYQKKYAAYLALLNSAKNGSLSFFDYGKLKSNYIQSETIQEIQKAQETGKYYDQQRASLKIQQDELRSQIASEKGKKDTDWGAVSDMEQQIKELEDQWMNFARDMMKALYDIDVKDWASQFGDALYEAWQKGEDGAEAFKKKASEIIGNIAKNILVKRVIETALQPVENAIVKMMDETSGELNERDFTEQIGSLLTNSIGKIVPTVNSALDAVENGLQKAGLSSLKENADSLSGDIKGITEDTASLLASDLNAIRADVSVNRMELVNIRENYLKDMKTQMVSASASLKNIESHTAAIMGSSNVIANKITSLDKNINDLRYEIWRVPMA